MPTLQSQFMEMTKGLSDPASTSPDQLNAGATRLSGWMTMHCQQARPYLEAPEGTQGTVITFTDGTAVTVVAHAHTATLEIHRGKCHDYHRGHWLRIIPNGQPASHHLQALQEIISSPHRASTSQLVPQAGQNT
jgi:hypothetical protein